MGDTKNIVFEWGPGRREATPGALELFYDNVDVKINVVRILLKETFLKSVIEIKSVRQDCGFEAGNSRDDFKRQD